MTNHFSSERNKLLKTTFKLQFYDCKILFCKLKFAKLQGYMSINCLNVYYRCLKPLRRTICCVALHIL